MEFKETSEEMKQSGDQVTIERLLPLATLVPGKYSLEVNATDALSNQTISKSADFTVKAAPETKTAAVAPAGRESKRETERRRVLGALVLPPRGLSLPASPAAARP